MSRRAGMRPEDTRRLLLDATLGVLREHGSRGVRVSEVAKRAGVSTGAIYSQFSSKADLVIAAVREHAPMVIAEHVAAGDHASVLALFAEVGRSLPARGAELGPLLLEMIVGATRDPDIAALVSAQFASNEEVSVAAIGQAQTDGEIDAALDAKALGRFLSMVSLGALVTGVLDLGPVEDTAWQDVVTRLLDAARPRS